MPPSESLLTDPRRVLELARRDRRAAERALATLSLPDQVVLVCEAPVAQRARLLELLPEPERVIPELPEAELCFTSKALGLEDAGWILEHATPEQLVACIDLDAWSGPEPRPATLDAWLRALAEAGDEALARAVREIDADLLVLWLRERVQVWLGPATEDFQPPPGSRSLDGHFHFQARQEGDDLAEVESLLQTLFERDYWLYFRLLQGVIWELPAESETWAQRWREGRLQDLGFPPWDEAMRIYGYVRPDRWAELPPRDAPAPVAEWRLPVWLPRLPAGNERHSLFRAIGKLEPAERRNGFFAFVALANRVAMADRLPLGEADSIPAAIEKAATLASRGLDHVAEANSLDPTEVLRRASLERLFRVGASLDPSKRPPLA
jgi:hypothetical protein